MSFWEIKKLQDFYFISRKTKALKTRIAGLYIKNKKIPEKLISELILIYEALVKSTDKNNILTLLYGKSAVKMDISYEINETEKDIIFLTEGENELYTHIKKITPSFQKDKNRLIKKLKGIKFKNFITDRDGTVNNYCGRYLTSVQAVYNFIFLNRFAKKSALNSVIMTAAPLSGLKNVWLLKNNFILAGSKGREFFGKQNRKKTFYIPKIKKRILLKLEGKIKTLLVKKENGIFNLIGSGLQFKFGEITIAKQDIYKSIPQKKSQVFKNKILTALKTIDPKKKYFAVNDTGLDIEIILKSADNKEFSKGHGLTFLNQKAGLKLNQGPNLICGDTSSDISMLEKSLKEKKEKTYGIFVTKNKALKNKIQKIHKKTIFVSSPDSLVCALNDSAKE